MTQHGSAPDRPDPADLIDALPALVWQADALGRNVYVNDGWRRYTGHAGDDALQVGWMRILHPDDSVRVIAHWQRSRSAGDVFETEARLRRWDSHYRWHSVRAVRHGEHWMGVAIDVHDARTTGEAIAAGERRFSAAFRSNPVPMAILTLDGRYLEVNDAMAAHSGYSREEMLGRTTADLKFFADARERAAYYRALADNTGVRAFLARLRVASGEIRDCVLSAERFDLDGYDCILAVRIDVTERTRAETALRESEARFRTLADAMPQLVWSASPAGVVDYYNAKSEAYAIRPDEPDWQPIVHPDDLEATWAAWRRANEEGASYEMEHRIRLADGSYRWHLGRALPVRDDDGRIVKWYGTATDIDDRKRAEEALKAADRRKDEFLAMLAHELRNPLAPIRTAAELLHRTQGQQAQARRAVDVVLRQSTHMARIVDDLLDVSRVTQGKINLVRVRLALQEVLAAAVEQSQPLLDARGHRLSVSCPPESLWMDGDAARLAQVIGNLLNNAAKYTEPGGHIALELRRQGEWAQIAVQDDGIGIAPELLSRVFELFTQADRSLDRAQGGLGIGLSLVRSLVELHGGSVAVHSAGLGKGARFVLRLPLA